MTTTNQETDARDAVDDAQKKIAQLYGLLMALSTEQVLDDLLKRDKINILWLSQDLTRDIGRNLEDIATAVFGASKPST